MSEGSHFRRAGRQPVALPIRFRRAEDGAALEHEGTTVDLGLGGAFVRTGRPPPDGARVVLILKSPTAWDPLELPARVRWVTGGDDGSPAGFGIRFEHLSGAQATALYELVHSSAFQDGEEAP